MFEALRGLRDAVAPESGNLGGGNASTANAQPDFDDLMQSYREGDTATIELVQRANYGVAPTKREDFIRIYAKLEMEKDDTLVKRLAGTVLRKSADIDGRVSELPGMHRTSSEQMAYMEQLLQWNQEASEALEQAYGEAQKRRDLVRKYVRDTTCEALGIVEDTE
jgi:hypothetical protein